MERFGRLDVLVNNAGSTKRGDFLTLSEADWADGFGLKFFGAMRCSRAAWPHLQASRGTIVNIIGVGGRTGSAEFAIGGAVNAALMNLTKVLADRGVKDGVRVNAINPGGIKTDRLVTRVKSFAAERNLDLGAAEQQMAQRARRRALRRARGDRAARGVSRVSSGRVLSGLHRRCRRWPDRTLWTAGQHRRMRVDDRFRAPVGSTVVSPWRMLNTTRYPRRLFRSARNSRPRSGASSCAAWTRRSGR